MRHAATELVGLARLFTPHLRPLRGRVIAAVALTLATPVVAGTLLWLVRVVVDDVLVAGRLALLWTLVPVYLGVAALKFSIDYLTRRLDASIAERLLQSLRTRVFSHALSLSPGSLGGRTSGDVLAHLSGDVDRVEILVYSGPLVVLADVAAALFFLVFLFAMSWKLTLIALAIVPVLAAVIVRLTPVVRRATRVARRHSAAWLDLAEERLTALPAIQAFVAEAHEVRRFDGAQRRARDAELRTVRLQAGLTAAIEGVVAVAGLALIVVGAMEAKRGTLTLGTVLAFLGALGSLYDPVRGLGQAVGRFQRAAVGARRVAALLRRPSLVRQRPSAPALVVRRGRIEFDHVTFGYPHGARVLDDVAFTIDAGETVAVAGPSGSGKSTLVRLLLRDYDATAGAIRIDGIDITSVTLASLRAALGVVLQEAYLARGSAADNIRYGHLHATAAEVEAAARAAHADAFLRALPGGYDTAIGTRGDRLSGGQRQRLALARALIRRAPILVLDEATASVDSEAEALIHASLDALRGRRTVLLVAHRLSAVRRADRVVVLDAGRVIETGSPARLLRGGTRCAALFAEQLAAERTAG